MDALATAPDCIRTAIAKYTLTPASDGESGTGVYRLHQAHRPSLYLKWGSGPLANDIAAEMARLLWLSRYLPVPRIHQFFYAAGQAWLLTTAMSGHTARECLAFDPAGRPQIVRALAEFLRELHALPLVECPFNSDHSLRMTDARKNLESGKVDKFDFNRDHEGWTAEDVWIEMQALLPM